LAVASHFALFKLFPTLEAEDLGGPKAEPDYILPPTTELPPPPPKLDRPRPPVPGDVEISEVTPPTTLDAYRDRPPPVAVEPRESITSFVPVTVKPELKSPAAALAIVEQAYPDMLKRAGVGGAVRVRARVDTLGRVVDAEILTGSGVPLLDRAALGAVRRFEFTPALNRDRKISVWVSQTIVFHTR
jgi:TonB family protein